jgi:hypothetical protein
MNKFLVLFFISFSLSAQIKAVVKDSLSGEPIPYVNIWVENETVGTTSEIDGTFSLAIKEEKVLVFSALGYETKKLTSTNEVIFLKPIAYELNEVVVEQPRFKEEIEIGNFHKSAGYHISGDLEWSNAKYFKYELTYEETKFVKKIKITTRSKVNNAKLPNGALPYTYESLQSPQLPLEVVVIPAKHRQFVRLNVPVLAVVWRTFHRCGQFSINRSLSR